MAPRTCGSWLLRTREGSGLGPVPQHPPGLSPMAAPPRPVPPPPAPRRPPPEAPLGDVLQQIMAITDQSLDEAQARCGAVREPAEAG